MLITAGLALIFTYAFYCCWINVPVYTGYQIFNNLTKGLRSAGPGLRLMIPFLESLVEPAISLKTNSHTFDVIFETQDEAGVKLTITIEEAADPDLLVEYSSFEEGDRIADIMEKIKAILSGEIRPMKNRDDVMDCLKELSDITKMGFKNSSENSMSLEMHFGTKLLSLELFPAALPEALVAAKAEQEAQVKKNETQRLQAANFDLMATRIVEEAKKHGQVVLFEKARRAIELEHGKGNLKEEINTHEIGPGLQEALGKVGAEVIERWLPKAKQ